MQIQFVSLDAITSNVGSGSVLDTGLVQAFNWDEVWLAVTRTGDSVGNFTLDYSIDNATWTSAGEPAEINSPVGITANSGINDGGSYPSNIAVTARYLRATCVSFGGSGSVTATIILNG